MVKLDYNHKVIVQKDTKTTLIGCKSYKNFSFDIYTLEKFFIEQAKKNNTKIAVGNKCSFRVYEALMMASKKVVVDIVGVDQNYKYDISQIKDLKNRGFGIFVFDYVDEDLFIENNLLEIKEILKDSLLISDISNAIIFKKRFVFDLAFINGEKIGKKSQDSYLLSNLDQETFENTNLEISKDLNSNEFDSNREFLIEGLKNEFKENISFVDLNNQLPNSLLARFKYIKAREIIKPLLFDGILITNGEGCSLGMGKPSFILQRVGFSEDEAREFISFSFNQISKEEILSAIKKISFRYKQIIALKGQK